MTETKDKCPFCGAESDGFGGLMCATYFTDLGNGVVLKRSGRCYESQIAQQQARIAELEGKLFKTADGVVVAIGDTVYGHWSPDIPCIITEGALSRCCSDGMCDPCELGDGACPDGEKYYSTPDAARAAKEKQ